MKLKRWEMAYAPRVGTYFIDHLRKTNQLEDPRVQVRNLQVQMLTNYMKHAEAALRDTEAVKIRNQSRQDILVDQSPIPTGLESQPQPQPSSQQHQRNIPRYSLMQIDNRTPKLV